MFDDLLLVVLIMTGFGVIASFLNRRLLTLLISSAFLLLVAMRLNIPYMYLMGTVLLALPAASYVIALLGARSLQVVRRVPDTATEGESVPVEVDVFSPFALFSGLVRINRHTPRNIRYVVGSERAEPIPGGMRYGYEVRPSRRGEYHLSACTLTLNDPLGIFVITRRFPASSTMVVYPTGLPVEEMTPWGESSAGWLMQTAVNRRGEEEGFYGTREYRTGDDLRRIHWRSSARHGNLVVVEREQGASGRLWIALDVRAGSERVGGKDSTLERAVKAVVCLMDAALSRGDAVGLLAPSPSGGVVPPAAGEEQRYRILEILARVKADGDTPLEDALQEYTLERGANVAAVTGAPTRELVESLALLQASGVGVIAGSVTAPAHASAARWPVLSTDEFAREVALFGAETLVIEAAVVPAGSAAPAVE